MSAHPRVRKASWMSSRISQRIRRRRNQCRWANAFHDPASGAEPGAVLGAPAGDDRLHAEIPDQAAVPVVVVAAVAQHHVRASPWPASLAPHRRYRLKQWDQPGDVVALAAGQGGGERDAGGVGDQVMFAARPAPIDGASSGLGSPVNARIWEPSTAARETSRAFPLWSSARRTTREPTPSITSRVPRGTIGAASNLVR
jgi:hypothetical protein